MCDTMIMGIDVVTVVVSRKCLENLFDLYRIYRFFSLLSTYNTRQYLLLAPMYKFTHIQ